MRADPRSFHLTRPQSGIVEQPTGGPSASEGPPPPVAPPTPMPPMGWYPAAAGRPPDIGLIVVAIVVILGAFLAIAFSLVGFPSPFLFSAAPFLCIPVIFVIIVLIIAFAQGASRRSIPPPPPIQQPMVPAGQQGPVALNCPNCGGPPANVDRFGIATCSYCGTRFLVR